MTVGRACTVVLLAALAACSRGGASPQAETPAANDTLRLSSTSDLPTLNTLISDNANLADFADFWQGYLFRNDGAGRFVPDLAVAVPTRANGGISADGLHVRYALRKNVRWQDGAPFDARDVVFSFRAAMNPNNNVPDRSGFDDIAEVTAPSPYAVDVRLKKRYSPAVASFFTIGANDSYPILPAHLLAKLANLNTAPFNAAPIGLGPYRVARWERGRRITLEANPHYHLGAPKIRRITIDLLPDQNTQLTVWRSGGLDVLPVRGFSGTQAMLDQARTVPHTHTIAFDHYLFDYLMFNTARPPLDEVAVRRAIVRGIDGENIMRELRGELHRPGSGDRLPGQFAYDPKIVQGGYDPAVAAKLLDEAGWHAGADGMRSKNGKVLAVEITTVAGTSLSERIGIQLQAALAKIGIRGDVKPYQYNVLLESARNGGIWSGGKYDITFYGWQPGEDDDHSYLFRCDTRPPNGENYGRICDPQIDRLAAIALATTDRRVEADADRAMLRRIEDQADVMFLGFDREAYVVRDGLNNYDAAVLGRLNWNAYSWYWSP